jgi:hypothetical protein
MFLKSVLVFVALISLAGANVFSAGSSNLIYNENASPIHVNEAPTVNAGNDQTITLPGTATLSGSYYDDGYPIPPTYVYTWSKWSGSGTVTFSNSHVANPIASFTNTGTYVIRLQVSDSQRTGEDFVTITVNPDTTAPIVSGGSPSGELTKNTTSTTMQVYTSEAATCKYCDAADTEYSTMPNTFSTTGSTTHSTTISGLQNGHSYTKYVRCNDIYNNNNSADYPVSWSVSNTTLVDNVISSEAKISIPNNALWNRAVNYRPGDGETIGTLSCNPPRFSWMYTCESPSTISTDIKPKKFRFQISTDPNFFTTELDVYTLSNMYNTIAPLTVGTHYWRVAYYNPISSLKADWDLTDDSWAATPYGWSNTRSFVIRSDAPLWDRSILVNNSAYLQSHSVHPHMLFDSTTRAGLHAWLDAYGGSDWADMQTTANNAINQAWWPNTPPTSYSDFASKNYVKYILNTAFVYAVTQDSRYSDMHPEQALAMLAKWYNDTDFNTGVGVSKGPICDIITYSSLTGAIQTIALGYDWLYPLMDATQKNQVLEPITYRCRYITKASYFYYNTVYTYGTGDNNGVYPGGCTVNLALAPKADGNHPIDNFHNAMLLAMSAYNDNADANLLFQYGINYMIGSSFGFGGRDDGSSGIGRSYSSILNYNPVGLNFQDHCIAQTIFPEAQFNKNPYWKNSSQFYDMWMPVGFVGSHEQWGDVGYGEEPYWHEINMGGYLSFFLNDPIILQHWKNDRQTRLNRNHALNANNTFTLPIWYYARNNLLGFSYPSTTRSTANYRAQFYPQGGFFLDSTTPPNTMTSPTDGISFVFLARPNGGWCQHDDPADLDIELRAYGSQITESGSHMGNYGRCSFSHGMPLAEGRGPIARYDVQAYNWHSRIFAIKNSTKYVYVAADGTNQYPRVAVSSYGGWTMPPGYNLYYRNAPLAGLTKVQRHVLLVNNSFFVIYDMFRSTVPFTYSVPYGIFRDSVTQDFANGGFSYIANTFTDASIYGGPWNDVKVFVKEIRDPSTVTFGDLHGEKVATNPFTTENYIDSSAGTTRDTNLRKHEIWENSSTPVTNFHFMRVIYPVRPGDSDPVIQRINDNCTKVIQSDGSVNVVSFDPSTAPSNATLLVDIPNLTEVS